MGGKVSNASTASVPQVLSLALGVQKHTPDTAIEP